MRVITVYWQYGGLLVHVWFVDLSIIVALGTFIFVKESKNIYLYYICGYPVILKITCCTQCKSFNCKSTEVVAS